jgi:hypothetical protein
MLKHIVTWKIKEFSSSEEKTQKIAEMKRRLENLKKEISVLKELEFGINSPQAAQDNWDVVLTTVFDNMEGLKTYQVHPAHVEVGKFVKEITAERACVDYEC